MMKKLKIGDKVLLKFEEKLDPSSHKAALLVAEHYGEIFKVTGFNRYLVKNVVEITSTGEWTEEARNVLEHLIGGLPSLHVTIQIREEGVIKI